MTHNSLEQNIRKLNENVLTLYLEELTAEENTKYSLWKAAKRIKTPIALIPPPPCKKLLSW